MANPSEEDRQESTPMSTSWIHYISSVLENSILLCSSSNTMRLRAMICS